MTNSSETIPENDKAENSIIKVVEYERKAQAEQTSVKANKETITNNVLYGATQLIQVLEKDTIKIDLQGIEVNKAEWEKFRGLVMISKEAQDRFLSDIIKDMVHHLLYENPELFNSYVRRSTLPPTV